MKQFLKIAAVLLVPFCATRSYGQVNEMIRQLHDPATKQVMVAAHRGDWRDAPENSLQAYKQAIALGVDMIEIDLHKTSDGVIVIMHDGTIDRTTDGKGKVSDYTYAQIEKFHLKNGLGRVTRNTIPTLEEVMLLAKGKVLVNLDKSLPYYQEAYEIVEKTGTLKQALFKSEEPYAEVSKLYPNLISKITFMAVVNLDKPDAKQVIEDYQKAIKPVAFELIFEKDTSALLTNNKWINTHGAKIWINSLWASLNGGHEDDLAFEDNNTADSWDWIINHGATFIQTDHPRELVEYLRKKHLHK